MKPIFIGGTGRSGTTILKQVLTCHTKIIALPDELRIIVDSGGALDLISALSDRWSPYKADIAIQGFRKLVHECARANSQSAISLEKVERKIFRGLGVSPRRYLGMGLAYHFGSPYLVQRLEQLLEELSFHMTYGSWVGSPPFRLKSKIYEAGPMAHGEVERLVASFFDDLYTHHAADRNKDHWLDDTPANLLYANELRRLFPNMKFIHIYRDPRDVMASFHGFSWGGDTFVAIARRLAGTYTRWLEIRQKLPTECFIEVSLEALATDPITELSAICKFIGLDFEQNLTNISLDKVHAGRWKQNIPEPEWKSVRHYLSKFIEMYCTEVK